MGAAQSLTSLGIARQFESLASTYRRECAVGTPMSVHDRYAKRLGVLRERLRGQEKSRHLGEILRQMGAVSAAQVVEALEIQGQQARKKLLGEVLIDLGWIDEETIWRAVEQQAMAWRIATEAVEQPSQGVLIETSRSDGAGEEAKHG